MHVVELRTGGGTTLRCELADTFWRRFRGLMLRSRLAPGTGILFVPCGSVHTAFMRFNIDVVFVNRNGYAVKIVEDVPPWRIAIAAQAHAVIELAAGSLKRHEVSIGDRLYVSPASDGEAFPTFSVERKAV